MKKHLGFFVACLAFFALIGIEASAQGSLDCVSLTENDPCGTWNGPIQYDMELRDPFCDVSFDLYWRECNGVIEYYYDNLMTSGNCEEMEDLQHNAEYLNSMHEMIETALLEDRVVIDETVPWCNEGHVLMAKVYSAACGIWVKCTYTVDPSANPPDCDDDWNGNPPHYQDGAEFKVDIWKHQSCGETCCRKTYKFCYKTSPLSGDQYLYMEKLPPEKLIECTDQSNYVNPCYDGCR
jgi:hypothetical protein